MYKWQLVHLHAGFSTTLVSHLVCKTHQQQISKSPNNSVTERWTS